MDWKARLAGQAGIEDEKKQCQDYQVCRLPVWEVGEKIKIWKKQSNDKGVEGSLKRNQSEPGNIIFSDQY